MSILQIPALTKDRLASTHSSAASQAAGAADRAESKDGLPLEKQTSTPANPPGWLARLNLRFSARKAARPSLFAVDVGVPETMQSSVQTVLGHHHIGPLRIQKPLYPEGADCCHAVLIHPPGGIACSDQLQLDAQIQAGAHALILTPAATKWYGAFQAADHATQHINLDVQGVLEWLPAESIVFNRARVKSTININVGPSGQMFGWDQLIFGRLGRQETFEQGVFDQTMVLRLGQELIWIDRMRLLGADPLFVSPLGLAGHDGCMTAWAVAPSCRPFDDALLDSARLAHPEVSFTRIHPRVLVMRALAPAMLLRRRLELVWHWFREHWMNRTPHVPRLWAT